MNSPPEDSNRDADAELVDLADISVASVSEQRRGMLPAAIAATAGLLIWRFLGVGLLDENAPIPDALRIGLSMLMAAFISAFPVWVVWRHGQRVFEKRVRFVDLLLEGAIAFGALMVVMGINIGIGLLWQMFSKGRGGMPEELEQLAFSENIGKLILLAVMACLWAPISEELFFRRMLLRALQGRMKLWAAVLLQAVLFTVMHSYQGIHLALIFILGLTLGGLYAWRGTIITSMMLHCLQNTGVTIVLGLLMWGSLRAPVLGITMENVDQGVKVVSVMPDSAAEKAGLQPGDVITDVRLGGVLAMQNQPTPDTATLKVMFMFQSPGDEVYLTVQRGDEQLDVTATLQDRKELKLNGDGGE